MTSGMPDPETYPKKPRSTRKKWYAVIIVLILLVSSFAVLSVLHPVKNKPEISVDTASNYLQAGATYTLSLKSNEPYKSITVYWGDNNETTINQSRDTLAISHVYNSSGVYYIHYKANFTTGIREFNTYIPVYVESAGINNRTSNGILTILNSSRSPVISNSNILFGNTSVNISIGNSGSPSNSTFKILNQTLYIYRNGSLDRSFFAGNTSKLTVFSGYYTMKLATETGNGTGTNYTTYYYMDIPVNPNAKIYLNTGNNSLVMDSLTPYTNLNPQEAYTKANLEILYNTEQLLIGKGNSGYFPEIASSLPASKNHINYTFHINKNVTFQNGIPVNAYDVYYSLVMDLLLENKKPQTPGWILAQYLLPGNYHNTNNYTNIMKAITYSNSSDIVTLNFTTHLNPNTVSGILSSPGSFISSAHYLSSHGENITWSQHGFNSFKARNYNYTMSLALSDGPYEIAFSTPGRYITLIRNPYFRGNSNNSVPTINSITIEYKSELPASYEGLRFNTSQLAAFPNSYPYVSSLPGVKPYNYSYNLSTIYNFNSDVNQTLLGKYVDGANLPSNLFSNITVREAFWNAYPGNNMRLAKDLWNSFISNSTEDKKFNLSSTAKYKGKPLVIPIFTTPLASGTNISLFEANLVKMIGNGSSFPIVSKPKSFINGYEYGGINPLPIYETLMPENMNISMYYNYLGNTMNYTHAYNNGFNYYSYNITDKNQSIIMHDLNLNISKLADNYNKTNITNIQHLLNSLHMYIIPLRNVEMTLYLQNYVIPENGTMNGQGIIFFNTLSI
jgi:hypothetical protein